MRDTTALVGCARTHPAHTFTKDHATFTHAPPCAHPTLTRPLPHSWLSQSAALRLKKDSGAVVNDGDLERGLQVQIGNTWRPAMVAECMQNDVYGHNLPER